MDGLSAQVVVLVKKVGVRKLMNKKIDKKKLLINKHSFSLNSRLKFKIYTVININFKSFLGGWLANQDAKKERGSTKDKNITTVHYLEPIQVPTQPG